MTAHDLKCSHSQSRCDFIDIIEFIAWNDRNDSASTAAVTVRPRLPLMPSPPTPSPQIDPEDGWGLLCFNESVSRNQPPNASSSTVDYEMDTPDLSRGTSDADNSLADEVEEIVLVSSDGGQVACARQLFLRHSIGMHNTIAGQDGAAPRIFLDIPYREVGIFVATMDADPLVLAPYGLEDLLRALELHVHYDVQQFNRYGLESAIMDRLEPTYETGGTTSRFDLAETRCVSTLRAMADRYGMDRLLERLGCEAILQGDELSNEIHRERPRKWRKISSNCAVAACDNAFDP